MRLGCWKNGAGSCAALALPTRTTPPYRNEQSRIHDFPKSFPWALNRGRAGAGEHWNGFGEDTPGFLFLLSCQGLGEPHGTSVTVPVPPGDATSDLCSQVLMDFHHQGITCSFGGKKKK